MSTDERTEQLMTALREVVDPEIRLDVVALGLIRSIEFGKDKTEVKMLLTTPFCPYAPYMIQQVKEIVEREVPDVPAHVELLADPWSPEMMEDPSLLGFTAGFGGFGW
jgi:metal-sulfur cluster biosynthetic enzyme